MSQEQQGEDTPPPPPEAEEAWGNQQEERGSNILEEMDLSDLEAFVMEDVQRVSDDIAVDRQISDITSDLRLAQDDSTDSLAELASCELDNEELSDEEENDRWQAQQEEKEQQREGAGTEGEDSSEELELQDWGQCKHPPGPDACNCEKKCECECEECWCDHQGKPCPRDSDKECNCDCVDCWIDPDADRVDWGPCCHGYKGDTQSCCCVKAEKPGPESCDCECDVCFYAIKNHTIPFAKGWRSAFSDQYQRFFYYNDENLESRQTCWNLPEDIDKEFGKLHKMVGRTKQADEVMSEQDHIRKEVLNETIAHFIEMDERTGFPYGSCKHYHDLANTNLRGWAAEAQLSADADKGKGKGKGSKPVGKGVHVLSGDWGDVTLKLTKEFGKTFAVLNMANPAQPGGGYLEGRVAQEENIYRRTNSHFEITEQEITADEYYKPEIAALVNGANGGYLDDNPRVCIRGREDRDRDDLGYEWLEEGDVFPFFELRSAADDHRDGSEYNYKSMQKKIKAQLDTLSEHGIKHAVLSAFGCGAFGNPATEVAKIYKEELDARHDTFECVAFGIFNAGYGPDDNCKSFQKVFLGTDRPRRKGKGKGKDRARTEGGASGKSKDKGGHSK